MPARATPIADYAFLSDCEVTALVAPSGDVDWLCLPRMDSPSVFGALLDPHAGRFGIGPAEQHVPAARRYIPGTMIVETSWGLPTGWLVVRDVLLIGPWHHEGGELSGSHRRAPTDYDSEHVLLRTVRCVDGEVQVAMECEPMFDYGRHAANWTYTHSGYHQARATGDPGGLDLLLTTDLRLGLEGGKATSRTLLKEGERRFAALSWTGHQPPRDVDEAQRRLTWTAHHWQRWLARGRFPDHPWRAPLERSALTLKGLTFAPTGALVAAPTTSLPETPGGDRNWDYRYTWMRDSAFTLWALYILGFDWEANDFFWFIADLAERDGDLQIMYGVDGERDLAESTLDHLEGYEGARPVRVGNGAFAQVQHDVWGSVLGSIAIHARHRNRLDDRIWPIVTHQVESARQHWRDPDRGIWEVRGEPCQFVSSKVMCWVALDRGAKLARMRGSTAEAAQWRSEADAIHADVCTNGVDERGVFVQHYDSTALDASALLIALTGFLPPDDPRVRATVLAVADELTVDGLVLRYRVEETDDGLQGEEGTFAICSFWLVSAFVMIGELERARELCEKMLSFASPLGLYAEEIDARTGRHLGNFPQAFTHLALVNAVISLIEAEDGSADRRSTSPRW
ncbi:MAG: glycoside hydrolase family 15 protein [Jatrophihabitans sp.]